jgi:hypothetical protein
VKTVVGLFSKDDYIQASISRLAEVGIGRDQVKVLVYEKRVADLLTGHQSQTFARYALWGMGISAAAFVFFELVGRLCDCGITFYGFNVEIDRLVLFVIAGVSLGLTFAYLIGVERLQGSPRPYTWNVQHGSKVVVVHVSDEREAEIIKILHTENGAAIKTLESRLYSLLHKNSHQ